jgi:hypothetical protein
MDSEPRSFAEDLHYEQGLLDGRDGAPSRLYLISDGLLWAAYEDGYQKGVAERRRQTH